MKSGEKIIKGMSVNRKRNEDCALGNSSMEK